MFNYRLVNNKKCVAVRFSGDLDYEAARILEDEIIFGLTKFGHANEVEIDMRAVPFVDSSGVGALIKSVETIKSEGHPVVITNVSSNVYDVFDLLQVHEILQIGIHKEANSIKLDN